MIHVGRSHRTDGLRPWFGRTDFQVVVRAGPIPAAIGLFASGLCRLLINKRLYLI
jgi:hypothetical protein